MTAHVICVTSDGGLPVFSRRKGNADNLPFSIIGSLNGTHMFGKPFNIELLSANTDDYVVSWRQYNNSLTLIAIASGCTLEVLNTLLESVINTVILIVGTDEIKSQRNVERLKRELRIAYPIIDTLMDSLDCGDSNSKNSSNIVGLSECIVTPENHLIQMVLDSFTESVDSMFSAVLVHGKIIVATENWWSLHPDEIRLLSLLAINEVSRNSNDIPVFLPYKSPNVAFRFVICSLIPNIQICCLCGPSPPLTEIEHSATQCFKNSTDVLNAAVQCHPRNFPLTYQIDSGILGLLFINITLGKYIISKNPQMNTTKQQMNSSHRFDILRTFYYQAVIPYLLTPNDQSYDKNLNILQKEKTNYSEKSCGVETYWCSEYHKCHAIKYNGNILCILYNSSVPTHSMRLISQNTIKLFLNDKQLCW